MKLWLRTILWIVLSFIFVQTVYSKRNEKAQPYSSKQNRTMKKIFLCSSFADVASILSETVSSSLKGKTVAFIPTASIHEEYTQYVEDGKSALRTLGLTIKEVEITQFDKNQITKILNDCDCIYVSGGNTFFLIQELRKTGTDKLIKEQVEMGKLYIGESAGTIILSPNIEYATKMDDYLTLTPNFNDFTGLGIIDFYPVVHFNCFPFAEATRNIINEYGHLPLKPITNQQAIVITGDAVLILGKTSKTE